METPDPPATRACHRLLREAVVDASGQVTSRWVEQDEGWDDGAAVTLALAG